MRPRRRILIVDDEYSQRRLFCRFFSERRYDATAVASAEEALSKAPMLQPHVALIDVRLPGMDGVALIRRFRSEPSIAGMPVILMTGLNVPDGLLSAASEGLGLGPVYSKGDCLLTLERRIDGELSSDGPGAGRGLRRGLLAVDPGKRVVRVAGRPVHVAGRRFELLCALLRDGAPVPRRALLKSVWPASDNLNVVDVNILRLRRDLADSPEIVIEACSDGYLLSAPT